MRKSIIRGMKRGPKKAWKPRYKAIKFDIPPKGARLIKRDVIEEGKYQRFTFKKGRDIFEIIIEPSTFPEDTAAEWREAWQTGRVKLIK